MKQRNFCGRTRREFLWQSGAGFGAAALTSMLTQDGFLSAAGSSGAGSLNPLAAKPPHFAPKAKSVIFLFMYGGPSHIDTFDYKPKMKGMDGKTVDVKTFGRGGRKDGGRIVEPRWDFAQHGQCGKWVSTLFPNVAKHVDDIAFLHSMTADSPIHGSAMLMMNSGKILSGSPAMGSWVNYGLGSVNENLPGYVVMLDPKAGPISGAKNWSSGYMPATYAGTVFRSKGAPILNLDRPDGMSEAVQREMIDSIQAANERHLVGRQDNDDLASRISSYELAYKMQSAAPEAVDLADEDERTLEMYGVNRDETNDFGTRCLIARRLVDRGVRFVQLYSGGAHNDDNWDAHGDLELNHNRHAGRTDLPIAGLLADLKQRGMLDETLVVWGGEFGRQPTAEYAKGSGRDHNSFGFTMWMAGGGIKGGVSYGTTDELGAAAVENPLHVKNMHATTLQLLGLDPNHLSYFYGGLDQKLVGVEHVEPIHEIIA
ncbi:DUF1501 domain-containing protein [Roseiconus lacunae]|uniref:DUF1501 domain-containing protein n=1 Tax=Roseiconus lacunae TaxID=2605694 RepID=A0ABT7PD95_9BACT|nr:DUF1501 domain-containing protein [Roseiconus lacunae]MCD0459776.1 DUF1501 domain-containing protein [Roseiconus lacunae]MDM4014473.1 DUF1501 domain-containing protein [Roseiconus lacunae]WRQ49788.1 DUF1501 domain-containing protein [Stieleria sp. HD01]